MNNETAIVLQENIPLSDSDLKLIETRLKSFKKVLPAILGGCTVLLMAFAAWCIGDTFAHLAYYEYILFAAAGLVMYAFCYGMAMLVHRYDIANWKKDKANGKNKLKSVVINRDKTEYGEYLTFAGLAKEDKIRIKVDAKDYAVCQVGTKVSVTYLKFSKEALELVVVWLIAYRSGKLMPKAWMSKLKAWMISPKKGSVKWIGDCSINQIFTW